MKLFISTIVSLTASLLTAQHSSHSIPLADTITKEKHLKNLRQLTFGGDNAEAYFSFDSKSLTFQSYNA
jgi:hypothetical protein